MRWDVSIKNSLPEALPAEIQKALAVPDGLGEENKIYLQRHKAEHEAIGIIRDVLAEADRNAAVTGVTCPHNAFKLKIQAFCDETDSRVAFPTLYSEEPPVYEFAVNAHFWNAYGNGAKHALIAHELGHIFCGHLLPHRDGLLSNCNHRAERQANSMGFKMHPVPGHFLDLLTHSYRTPDIGKDLNPGWLEKKVAQRRAPDRASEVFDIVKYAEELAHTRLCDPVTAEQLCGLPKKLRTRVTHLLHPRVSHPAGAGEAYYGLSH